jgi:hypothetical protein
MRLYPFYAVVKQAEDAMHKGGTVYQQFNCANCGTKQTIDNPNVFHKTGQCEECGAITDIEKDGANFMVMFESTKK